jgi:hypothetical protein
MPATFKVQLDKRFQKEAKGRIERFQFDVGVLDDRPHMLPAKGIKSLAGGKARKVGRKSSGLTISQVSEELRKHLNINFYTRPFRNRRNRELVKFIGVFMAMITQGGGRSDKRRIENALQAVVRNPITRGDYGRNTRLTAKIKGFNRLMIDTGQLFKAIKARVRFRRV